MLNYVFILGACDPEMEAIEEVLKANQIEYRYACLRGRRVRSHQANQADSLNELLPKNRSLVFVECRVMGLSADVIVDHHQEGDPGYGKPPAKYLEGSSLGQVLTLLGIEPNLEQRLIAAADHCPTQAYRGECPGVDPQELARWRTRTRAQRRGVSEDEMERAIEEGKEVLLSAPRIAFKGIQLPWVSTRDKEVAEASARFGIPFMYAEPSTEGFTKVGIMGAPPEVISAWMQECGMSRVYGDPARGYAGGYC